METESSPPTKIVKMETLQVLMDAAQAVSLKLDGHAHGLYPDLFVFPSVEMGYESQQKSVMTE